MWRILVLILVAVAGGVAAMWLMQVQGRVDIRVDSLPGTPVGEPWLVSLAPVAAIGALLVASVALASALGTLGFVFGLPGRIGKRLKEARRRRAQEAFTVGLLAHQGGDHRRALKLVAKAAEHANDKRLPLWLEAQAAVATGDLGTAERAYSALAEQKDSALAGLKGLAEVAVSRGDRAGARRAAEAAFALPAKAEWAFNSSFELATAAGDWTGALKTLQTAVKARMIAADPARRRKAVLLTAEANRLTGTDDRTAEKLAVEAATIAPTLPPAVYSAAQILAARGQAPKAEALIEQAWAVRAHPALGALYADLRGPTGSTTRAARFRKLAAIRPTQRESLFLTAEAAMLQADWPDAEQALKAILEENVTSRACALMADLMRASGRGDVATMWAARAAASPRESDWSDLELDGKAFNYSDAEWARLAYVFGDAGQMIHPRQEAQARDLPANAMLALTAGRGAMSPERIEPGLLIDASGRAIAGAGLIGGLNGGLGGGPVSGGRTTPPGDVGRPPPDYADEDYGY